VSGTDIGPLDDHTIDRYLDRIGADAPTSLDLRSLTTLARAHLVAVPFENLDVFHRHPVQTSLDWSIPKIVDRRRGGWCFELNGAFGALLRALGFEVRHIGAAVLLDGPNSRLDHLCLEVRLDQPYLVDVGFGDTFITPLELNASSEQDGGNGRYQFISSPIGTTLAHIVDDVPRASYRFKRVSHELSDFDPASDALARDPDGHFRKGPLATRLLDTAGSRVTLSTDRLVVKEADGSERSSVRIAPDVWWATAREWFGESYGPEIAKVF
jgi:N-hydroxyarylamine O-acetyltransferase